MRSPEQLLRELWNDHQLDPDALTRIKLTKKNKIRLGGIF